MYALWSSTAADRSRVQALSRTRSGTQATIGHHAFRCGTAHLPNSTPTGKGAVTARQRGGCTGETNYHTLGKSYENGTAPISRTGADPCRNQIGSRRCHRDLASHRPHSGAEPRPVEYPHQTARRLPRVQPCAQPTPPHDRRRQGWRHGHDHLGIREARAEAEASRDVGPRHHRGDRRGAGRPQHDDRLPTRKEVRADERRTTDPDLV